MVHCALIDGLRERVFLGKSFENRAATAEGSLKFLKIKSFTGDFSQDLNDLSPFIMDISQQFSELVANSS